MDNRKILPGVILFALFIILCGILFRFLITDTKTYYAVVKNEKVARKSIKNKTEYILDSYDKKGNKYKLKFKTDKVLKKGTYLKFKISRLHSVVKCKKIKYRNLPKLIRLKLK